MNQQLKTAEPIGKRKDLQEWMETDEFKFQVQRSLPEGMRAERFVRIALTATSRNPKLLECTQGSFFKCLMDLSGMGLEPDGRRAHLIPFRDNRNNVTTCTLIVDYKGIAELVRRNGDVASIHCDVVGKNDVFICRYGTGGKLEHVPNIVDRGEIYAVYSFVRLKGGEEEWEVMSTKEVEKIRSRSKSANDGPWVTDWPEMAKKTVFRRHSKTLPLSPLTRAAVEHGEDEEFEGRFANAVPARTPRSAALDQLSDDGADVEPPPPPPPPKEPAPPLPPPKEKEKPKPAAPPPPPPKESAPPPPAPARKPATKAEQLAAALEVSNVKWAEYANWITSLTGIAAPASPKDLPANILADCIMNYDANLEAFNDWVKDRI